MLPVADAQEIVLRHARQLPAAQVAMEPAALGWVLAEEIDCDLDQPPFDKAMMDGYAVRCGDLAGGKTTLVVVGEVTAGRVPDRVVGEGEAIRITTGAPIPAGADAVVPIERTRTDGDRVRIEAAPKPGTNVLRRAAEMARGDVVLRTGAVLRPQEFGLLASVGRTAVRAIPAPEVAVLATGDELVDPSEMPGPGQIRNSNAPMLVAQTLRAGARARPLGIARDTADDLRDKIAEGLRSPVLVLSGGVSAGKLDLVPEVLRELDVEAHFHKIELKPGKPLFFGTRGDTLVFGLPGNPVSSFVCFELFVRPAIRARGGHADVRPKLVQAVLADVFPYATDRPTYHPADLTSDGRGWTVRMVKWFGSPDLRAVTAANALAVLPVGDHVHARGAAIPVIVLD